MATRSAIAIDTGNGIRAIYCHWDGHIESAGKTLQKSYQDAGVINELMDLGDLSTLAADPDACAAFTRDYNEPEAQTRARDYNTIQEMLEGEFEDSDREYVYVFLKKGKWAVISAKTAAFQGPQLLSDELALLRRNSMHAV
jgi:hypothetical protein